MDCILTKRIFKFYLPWTRIITEINYGRPQDGKSAGGKEKGVQSSCVRKNGVLCSV